MRAHKNWNSRHSIKPFLSRVIRHKLSGRMISIESIKVSWIIHVKYIILICKTKWTSAARTGSCRAKIQKSKKTYLIFFWEKKIYFRHFSRILRRNRSFSSILRQFLPNFPKKRGWTGSARDKPVQRGEPVRAALVHMNFYREKKNTQKCRKKTQLTF